ncbi:protein translocase subunit SecF [Candidatus Wolfebacteria bacterium CG10_big_fil_rev_8_21_14_0_10_31_9]|uniref:Protein-export membrane protein SecF n=1 Tax=Candidatus Wolfebacteria bacterium CG10_big_fil_rev_8_21_14_0_10_31_9 TaxID=1975070 RepID=A0A2H0RCJ6_9BACT|nr:MAG: protein translocase subunit SecF [Candidatus Wolfebacteria bacterium CG10_big_fil_rev_8_21_14_0_10_31_9]
MNIIKHKAIFLSVSGVLVLVGVVALLGIGLKTGIDFNGGTLWQIKLTTNNSQITTDELGNFLRTNENIKNVSIFSASDNSVLIKLDNISENDHQKYLGDLKSNFGAIEELKFESIGPSIGSETKQKAYWAIVLVLLGISIYVAFAFRKVSYPISSWKYGVITLISLFHDVLIAAGFFAILGYFLKIEIDTNFVVALLVVMGFSVHDTIVVFDRIRENILIQRNKEEFSETVNRSIVQTLARSINTTLTVVLVLLAMFLFGPAALKYFILTLLVGIIAGTYSSIFVASPLLTIWHKSGRVN